MTPEKNPRKAKAAPHRVRETDRCCKTLREGETNNVPPKSPRARKAVSARFTKTTRKASR